MRPPSRWASLKTGVAVSAAAALVFLTVVFSDSLLSIFAARAPLYLMIQKVQGLRTGAPVWVLGVEVGLVDNVRLMKGGTLVELEIKQSSLRYIHADATGWVRTMGLLGDKYVDIGPGTAGKPLLAAGDTITGNPVASMEQVIEASFASIGAVEAFVTHMDTLLLNVQRGEGTLAQLIYNKELYENIAYASEVVADIGRAFEQNQGTVRLLLEDRELYDRLVNVATHVQTLTDTLLHGGGALPQLISDSRVYDELLEGIDRATTLLDSLYGPHSPMGVLMKSETAGQDLQRSLAAVRRLLEDMQQNPGKYFKFELF